MSGKKENLYRYGENAKSYEERKEREREARERRAEAYAAYQRQVAAAKKAAYDKYNESFAKKKWMFVYTSWYRCQ